MLDGTTYYFTAFALDSNDNIIDTVTNSVTTDFGWHVTPNTLLYLPLESNVVDQSGQSTTRTFTSSGISFTSAGGLNCISVGSSGGLKLTAPYGLQSDLTKPITVSLLLYRTTTADGKILDMAAQNSNRQSFDFTGGQLRMSVYNHNNDSSYAKLYANFTTYQWNHVVYTITKTSSNLYVNGVLISNGQGNPTYPWGLWPYSRDNSQGIFCERDVNSYRNSLNGYARELIMEQVEWSADDVSKYYTWIKNKLGF